MMTATALSSAFQAMVPVATEAEAATNLAGAYATYAEDAQTLTPILAPGVELGRVAMAAALTGMSTPGAAAAVIAGGIQAFWVAVAGGLATSFAGAVAITPPSPTLIAVDLQTVFNANTASSLSISDSADALSVVVHAKIVGGTVTTAGPTVTPIV